MNVRAVLERVFDLSPSLFKKHLAKANDTFKAGRFTDTSLYQRIAPYAWH